MTNYLEVKNLSKSFDSFQLHNITFTLPKGYIMGLIGPNGSGKTTTIKLILNMLKRNGGEIKIMGLDNIADEQKAKAELGVVFDTNYFSDDWKVSEVEKSISVFYPNWNTERFSEMLRKFHIAPTKKVKELSKGMQMKLMLACAFSYDAKLLILDEPTSGLDPVSRDELLQILSEYIEDGEHSVLFSTHITGDLERAADYITYISYGELFFTGSKDEFVDMFRIVKGGMDELSADLQAKAVGVRTFPTGFEALVKTEDIGSFTALDIEPATIDEIVVFTSKKGEDLALNELLKKKHNPALLPIQIAYFAGLRIGEVCGLTWQDIDLKEQCLTIRRSMRYDSVRKKTQIGPTKRKKIRTVDFCDTLAAILREAKKEQMLNSIKYGPLYSQNYYRIVKEKNRTYYEVYSLPRTETPPEGYTQVSFVCLRSDGAYEAPATVSSVCRYSRKKIGDMDDFHFHLLRHTYTTNLLSHGAAPKDVQELLGHSDVSTTMNIYAHATREAKRTSARLLDKVVGTA